MRAAWSACDVCSLACAAVLLALGAAGPAHAEIVWSKNSEIWAMHDDGSAQRKLIAPVDVGMTHLRAPMPAPTGATFAYTGDTNANRFTIVGLCGTSRTRTRARRRTTGSTALVPVAGRRAPRRA